MCVFSKLEAVGGLVGANERHERKLVELELGVVGSLEHSHLSELPGDDAEYVLGARELRPLLRLRDLLERRADLTDKSD